MCRQAAFGVGLGASDSEGARNFWQVLELLFSLAGRCKKWLDQKLWLQPKAHRGHMRET